MGQQALTWLAVAYIDGLVLFGRARFDPDDDLLTVTTLRHGAVSTQVGGGSLKGLAKLMLVDLHKAER